MLSVDKNILEISSKGCDIRNAILLCSSGVDSLAMTHYFLSKNPLNAKYTVIHFNHNLREENKLMAESCQKFIDDIFPNTYYWSILNTNKDLKTEDDFRKFRISKLRELFFVNKMLVFTAHHLDDCVESYLLNTIRGHPEYLPIPFYTDINNRKSFIRLCKPFLFNRKKDFIAYAIKHDIYKYVVEDSTNKVVKGSRRNLMRNEIIPILEREKVGLHTIVSKRMKKRLMIDMLG